MSRVSEAVGKEIVSTAEEVRLVSSDPGRQLLPSLMGDGKRREIQAARTQFLAKQPHGSVSQRVDAGLPTFKGAESDSLVSRVP